MARAELPRCGGSGGVICRRSLTVKEARPLREGWLATCECSIGHVQVVLILSHLVPGELKTVEVG